MLYLLAAEISFFDWANTVFALLGVCAGIIALIQSRRSNQAARAANKISQEATDFAAEANHLAKRALQMQEDDGRVRLVVKPRMICLAGEDEDSRPRPIVEVINLSVFPVTVTQIYWKTNCSDGGFYWKNPTITNPFNSLPARLPAREGLTALGTPSSFASLEDLRAITAAVVVTACGERIEGMTKEWQEEVARIVNEQPTV